MNGSMTKMRFTIVGHILAWGAGFLLQNLRRHNTKLRPEIGTIETISFSFLRLGHNCFTCILSKRKREKCDGSTKQRGEH